MADPPVLVHRYHSTMLTRLLLLLASVPTLSYDYNYDNYNYNNYQQNANSNNYYGDAGSDDYYGNNNNQQQDISVSLSVCQDSVVEMTSLDASCDSPYTFYYGNGANRNSATCDYGDKVSLTGTFQVVDNLQYGDDIYITAAVYDDANNLLATIAPTHLCDTYVGSDCTVAGTYSFSERLKLEQPTDCSSNSGAYSSSSSSSSSSCTTSTQFRPVVQMAFSTKPDSGYNLGAVNTQCTQWDQNNPSYMNWSDIQSQRRTRFQVFLSNNGMLIATCLAMAAFAKFIWVRAAREQRGNDNNNLGFSSSQSTSTVLDVGIMELS